MGGFFGFILLVNGPERVLFCGMICEGKKNITARREENKTTI